MPLAETIHSIRKRLKLTQSEFGKRIGVRANTVSQYENGLILPGRSALLLLLPLAEDDEREPILEALGEVPSEMQLWEADIRRRADDARKELSEFFAKMDGGQRARERFFDLAIRIVKNSRSPTPLIRALELWDQHAGSSAAREVYEEAIMALATDLDRVERGLPPVGKKPGAERPDSVIGKVMMQCPTTKKWFDTGSRMRTRDFEVSDFGGLAVFCPHCRMSHPFDKMRATVQQEE